jgi:hypothetical protein
MIMVLRMYEVTSLVRKMRENRLKFFNNIIMRRGDSGVIIVTYRNKCRKGRK